jgi:hypothetical protein
MHLLDIQNVSSFACHAVIHISCQLWGVYQIGVVSNSLSLLLWYFMWLLTHFQNYTISQWIRCSVTHNVPLICIKLVFFQLTQCHVSVCMLNTKCLQSLMQRFCQYVLCMVFTVGSPSLSSLEASQFGMEGQSLLYFKFYEAKWLVFLFFPSVSYVACCMPVVD